jgi:hypothetical protein
MIPYRSNILSDVPPALEKRLQLIEALARHTAQDHRAAAARSGPTIREAYPELAALWQWLILKYSPDQPRVPAGSAEGGQWTKGEGDSPAGSASGSIASDASAQANSPSIDSSAAFNLLENDNRVISDVTPNNLLIPVVGWEHHFVPWGTFNKYDLQPATRQVFVDATSGPLEDTTANKWGPEHKAYNGAVDEAFKSFLKRNNIPVEEAWRLTPAQAEEFVDEVAYFGCVISSSTLPLVSMPMARSAKDAMR